VNLLKQVQSLCELDNRVSIYELLFMTTKLPQIVATMLLIAFLPSCKDEELEREAAAKEMKVKELRGVLNGLKAQVADDPGDQTKAIAKAKKRLAKISENSAGLEKQLAELKKERVELEDTFEDYKKRYKISGQ